jgi:hypothetical protein
VGGVTVATLVMQPFMGPASRLFFLVDHGDADYVRARRDGIVDSSLGPPSFHHRIRRRWRRCGSARYLVVLMRPRG